MSDNIERAGSSGAPGTGRTPQERNSDAATSRAGHTNVTEVTRGEQKKVPGREEPGAEAVLACQKSSSDNLFPLLTPPSRSSYSNKKCSRTSALGTRASGGEECRAISTAQRNCNSASFLNLEVADRLPQLRNEDALAWEKEKEKNARKQYDVPPVVVVPGLDDSFSRRPRSTDDAPLESTIMPPSRPASLASSRHDLQSVRLLSNSVIQAECTDNYFGVVGPEQRDVNTRSRTESREGKDRYSADSSTTEIRIDSSGTLHGDGSSTDEEEKQEIVGFDGNFTQLGLSQQVLGCNPSRARKHRDSLLTVTGSESCPELSPPSLRHNERVTSKPGAFAVQGQTMERRTTGFISPMPDVQSLRNFEEGNNERGQSADDVRTPIHLEAQIAPNHEWDARMQAAVLATNVAPIKEHKNRRREYAWILLIIVFVLVSVGVGVTAGLLSQSKGDTSDPTPSTTPPPRTPVPTTTSATLSTLQLATINYLVANGISDEAALSDRNSPQYLAAEWICNEDPLGLDFTNSDEEPQWVQRYVLATFYFSTNGDNWRECGRESEGCNSREKEWLVAEDECQWFGLRCNGATPGVVNIINFNHAFGNFLLGTLPEEMFQLSDLHAVAVTSNDLYGTMSESWGHLTQLQDVLLVNNNFTGPIPDAFWQSRTLRRAFLGYNRFEGQIPTLLSGFPFATLRLQYNLMDGPIPDEIFDVTSLEELVLSGNEFTGTLSEQFSSLTALRRLDLNDNLFRGPIPAAFDSLTGLLELRLELNDLNGTISNTLCFLREATPSVDCEKVTCPAGCCECF